MENSSDEIEHSLNSSMNFNNHENGAWCENYHNSQHWLFHLANVCFFFALIVPGKRYFLIYMHGLLVLGFLVLSGWAWRIVCSPDMFSWSVCFFLLNILHIGHTVYRVRPVAFNAELEETYQTLFHPFKVSRLQFKKLVSEPCGQMITLHAGEAYAMQNITKTDRLALLLSGKVNVLQDHQLLHPIQTCEFLDSPEFESRVNEDDKFKVSVIAATPCRVLFWHRSSLEYLFVKETYLATVVAMLIASDITNKLYTMNAKMVTQKGAYLDIRLPSITLALASHSKYQSGKPAARNSVGDKRHSPEKTSRLANGGVMASELEILKELPSMDDLTGASGIENWLDTSSKYHSCEILDT